MLAESKIDTAYDSAMQSLWIASGSGTEMPRLGDLEIADPTVGQLSLTEANPIFEGAFTTGTRGVFQAATGPRRREEVFTDQSRALSVVSGSFADVKIFAWMITVEFDLVAIEIYVDLSARRMSPPDPHARGRITKVTCTSCMTEDELCERVGTTRERIADRVNEVLAR